jgi:hypothetical protein
VCHADGRLSPTDIYAPCCAQRTNAYMLVLHSLKNGVHFKVSQKRTSYHSAKCYQNGLLLLSVHQCATEGLSALRAATMGPNSSGCPPTQRQEVPFTVAPGRYSGHNHVSHVCSLNAARCGKSWHLNNGLFGRRGQRGVFPDTAAAGAAQPNRYALKTTPPDID